MSKTASSTGPSNSADERQPLLGSRAENAHIDAQPDPEAAIPVNEREEAEIVAKKVDYWTIFWYLVFAAFAGVLLAGIIKGFVENGDVEVRVVVLSAIYRMVDYPSLTRPVV